MDNPLSELKLRPTFDLDDRQKPGVEGAFAQ